MILDVPILAMGPSGRPVIDMKELLTTRARDMLSAGGGIGGFLGAGLTQANPRLAALKSAKAFPENVEISYEMPTAGGRLQEIHFSLSRIPDNTGYTPYAGRTLTGWPVRVWSRGEAIVDQIEAPGQLRAERGRGRFLARDRSDATHPAGQRIPEMAQLREWGIEA